MKDRSSLLLCIVLAASSDAFSPLARQQHAKRRIDTALRVIPPPLIISGAFKKLTGQDEEKGGGTAGAPPVDMTEALNESPGLRIGRNAWKWPPVWPYDQSYFQPTGEAAMQAKQQSLQGMASMLTGVPNMPGMENEGENEQDKPKFNPIEYWSTEQAGVKNKLDEDSIAKMQDHLAFYLKDGMSILELGAAEESYLPKGFTPSRHVGIGANDAAMKENPCLTESLVIDLNQVSPDRDVDSDDLRRLATEPFDAVIMTNTVEFLVHPREVFRSAWYLLKPGGTMFVVFSGKEATKNVYVDARTKIWQQYNDDQHMWITGSFFQFSAGDGWKDLIGFDISPESAKNAYAGNIITKALDQGKNNNLYVVQASKGTQDETINPNNVEESINSLTWMLPGLESRDKMLVVPRLARAYELSSDDSAVQEAIERNLVHLPAIYEALMRMDQFAFTFSMQAQMAADLVLDPAFEANDAQMLALREGLGLRTPNEEFWLPVGQQTAAMQVEDKINLLAYIVPRFGSDNPAQEEALQAFCTALKPTFAVLRQKCPGLPESDIQLLGTELLAAEVLIPGRSTRQEFATWLASMTETELLDYLAIRKSFPIQAKDDLKKFKQERKDIEVRREDYKKQMDEQIARARANRSMIFNPRTEKMEIFDRK